MKIYDCDVMHKVIVVERTVVRANNIEEIKLAIEQVNSSFYPISEKMYKESQTNQSNESTQNTDSVVDTDYEIVD